MFGTLSAQAILGRLWGLVPASGHNTWGKEAIRFFLGMAAKWNESGCVATLKGTGPGRYDAVELSIMADGRDFGDAMVENQSKKLAERVQ